MKQDRISALDIDLGTTNSSAAEITWDPASGNPPSVRILEIEQSTWETVFSSPLLPAIVAIFPGSQVGISPKNAVRNSGSWGR